MSQLAKVIVVAGVLVGGYLILSSLDYRDKASVEAAEIEFEDWAGAFGEDSDPVPNDIERITTCLAMFPGEDGGWDGSRLNQSDFTDRCLELMDEHFHGRKVVGVSDDDPGKSNAQHSDAVSEAPPSQTSGTEPSTGTGLAQETDDSVDVLVDRIGPLMCDSDDGYSLTEDVTDIDEWNSGADKILRCTTGGSMVPAYFGTAYFWADAASIEPHLPSLAACRTGGVTVSGGDPGEPGYLIADIPHDSTAELDALVQAGAERKCG